MFVGLAGERGRAPGHPGEVLLPRGSSFPVRCNRAAGNALELHLLFYLYIYISNAKQSQSFLRGCILKSCVLSDCLHLTLLL